MSTIIPSGTYTLDPAHTRIGFVARHAMVTKVRGDFTEFAGSGTYDSSNPSATSLHVEIAADSIDTRNADRDAHLRTNEFFDMENHPTITFTSTAVEQDDDDIRISGDLTVRGVTKPVTFAGSVDGSARDPFGNDRIGIEASTTVNRRDFGIAFDVPLDAGGLLVGEKVTLEIEASAILTPHG
ncbi:MAG: YceI family protein [Microthrixaceae bacterium]